MSNFSSKNDNCRGALAFLKTPSIPNSTASLTSGTIIPLSPVVITQPDFRFEPPGAVLIQECGTYILAAKAEALLFLQLTGQPVLNLVKSSCRDREIIGSVSLSLLESRPINPEEIVTVHPRIAIIPGTKVCLQPGDRIQLELSGGTLSRVSPTPNLGVAFDLSIHKISCCCELEKYCNCPSEIGDKRNILCSLYHRSKESCNCNLAGASLYNLVDPGILAIPPLGMIVPGGSVRFEPETPIPLFPTVITQGFKFSTPGSVITQECGTYIIAANLAGINLSGFSGFASSPEPGIGGERVNLDIVKVGCKGREILSTAQLTNENGIVGGTNIIVPATEVCLKPGDRIELQVTNNPLVVFGPAVFDLVIQKISCCCEFINGCTRCNSSCKNCSCFRDS